MRRVALQTFMQTVDGVFGARAQATLLSIYWLFPITTALAECVHARNAQLLHKFNAFPTFAANTCMADSKAMSGPSTFKIAQQMKATHDGVAEVSHADRNKKAWRVSFHLGLGTLDTFEGLFFCKSHMYIISTYYIYINEFVCF